jgi:hypothetical protein
VPAAGECITADPNQIDKYNPYRQHAPTSATTGTTVRNQIVLLVCKRGHSSVRDEQMHLRNSKKKKKQIHIHNSRPDPSANPHHDHSTTPQPFPRPYCHSISNLSARRVVRTSSVSRSSGSSSRVCGRLIFAVLRERKCRTQTEHIGMNSEYF